MTPVHRILPVLATCVAVAGCAVPVTPPEPALEPAPAPAPLPRVEVAPTPIVPPDALVTRFAQMEQRMRRRGLLRTDGGGPDTPFTSAMLARNFVQIALYDEYRRDGDQLHAEPRESRLRRWDGPVRMAVSFGDSVAEDRRLTDRATVRAYAGRLSRITGLPITQTDAASANYHVLFIGEDDRRAAGPLLRQLVPGIDPTIERALTDLDPETLCVVVAFSANGGWSHERAIAIIRDEHRGLFRRSCVHEELAQGLGLVNDSPRARPSIFNDDEEFALLTRHDELLLKILYDPRLQTGMDQQQVKAILPGIIDDVMPDDTPKGPPA